MVSFQVRRSIALEMLQCLVDAGVEINDNIDGGNKNFRCNKDND